MKKMDDFIKDLFGPDVEDTARALEKLDANSQVLAKTYISALTDAQALNKPEQAAVRTA